MERNQTKSEKAYLESLLAKLPTGSGRTKQAVENFFVLLAVSTLLGVLVWAALAWLMQKTINLEIGWDSEYAIPVIISVLALSAAYAVYSTAQWMKSWPDHRQPLRDDLIAGIVTEEQLAIVEAKLLQEPEHGGLIYCLRSDDGRMYSLLDRESLELGMTDEEPDGSRFEPQSIVTIVKAPLSQFTINVSFSGDEIDVFGPIALTASPDKWPEDQEFCSIPWDQLEKELCA